jgi:predicted Ser/Thr protein kinase
MSSAVAWTILIAGVAHKGMNAMSRQLLAPFLLLLFASAQLSRFASNRTKFIAMLVLAPILVALFCIQIYFMYRFTRYQWVA